MFAAEEVSVTTEIRFGCFDEDEWNVGEFTCLGRKWRLRIIYNDEEYADGEMFQVFLDNNSKKITGIFEVSFVVKNCDGTNRKAPKIFTQMNYAPGKRWFIPNFESLSTLLDYLVNGDLFVEVHMKIGDPFKTPPPFVPENPSACKVIQGMFMDEETSDVVIEVGGKILTCNAKKKAKTSSVTIFFAHRVILQKCSSTFAELFAASEGKTTPIRITDVSPDIFRHLLYYVYGGSIADDVMNSHAKEIVDVANKYGVVNLKLEAEACLVKMTCFTVENLLDLLMYAESKNCALLKEAAMDFMIKHKEEVIKEISFNDVPGALVGDVLAAMARGEKMGGTDESRNGFGTMRISELRQKAHDNGLNVDGSREMLIAALEEASNIDA